MGVVLVMSLVKAKKEPMPKVMASLILTLYVRRLISNADGEWLS